MHSYIYEISKCPIQQDMYLTADEITDGTELIIDYSRPVINEDERAKALAQLIEKLPKNMFRLDPDGNAIIFRGGMHAWKKKYVKKLYALIENIEKDFNRSTAYAIERYVDNPFETELLFVTDLHTAEHSKELMHITDSLVIGEKLYVGGIFDYHY